MVAYKQFFFDTGWRWIYIYTTLIGGVFSLLQVQRYCCERICYLRHFVFQLTIHEGTCFFSCDAVLSQLYIFFLCFIDSSDPTAEHQDWYSRLRFRARRFCHSDIRGRDPVHACVYHGRQTPGGRTWVGIHIVCAFSLYREQTFS